VQNVNRVWSRKQLQKKQSMQIQACRLKTDPSVMDFMKIAHMVDATDFVGVGLFSQKKSIY